MYNNNQTIIDNSNDVLFYVFNVPILFLILYCLSISLHNCIGQITDFRNRFKIQNNISEQNAYNISKNMNKIIIICDISNNSSENLNIDSDPPSYKEITEE